MKIAVKTWFFEHEILKEFDALDSALEWVHVLMANKAKFEVTYGE